jgi:hypothetical protein
MIPFVSFPVPRLRPTQRIFNAIIVMSTCAITWIPLCIATDGLTHNAIVFIALWTGFVLGSFGSWMYRRMAEEDLRVMEIERRRREIADRQTPPSSTHRYPGDLPLRRVMDGSENIYRPKHG